MNSAFAGNVGAVAFWLLVGHALADYILQPLQVSIDKNPYRSPINWPFAMCAHCLTNAGAVALATGSITLGVCEGIAHFFLDVIRCERITTGTGDQVLHLICKGIWLTLWWAWREGL